MSLSDPLTVGGVVYNRVNQDNYGSEFMSRDSLTERRLFITHTNEKKLVNGEKMERHAVKYSRLEFATETEPQNYAEVSFSMRFQKSEFGGAGARALSVIRLLIDDQTVTSTDMVDAIAGWQS